MSTILRKAAIARAAHLIGMDTALGQHRVHQTVGLRRQPSEEVYGLDILVVTLTAISRAGRIASEDFWVEQLESMVPIGSRTQRRIEP